MQHEDVRFSYPPVYRDDPDIAHSHTCHGLHNHTPQSPEYPTCADSFHMPNGNIHIYNNYGRKYINQFNDHQYETMMKDYYKHNQDKMTPAKIKELKIKVKVTRILSVIFIIP